MEIYEINRVMRILLLFVLIGSLNFTFGQEKEQPLKNLFNEYQISINHGAANPRTFFGGGLGAGHVFRSDKTVGSKVGLEADFFHFWNGEITPPYSNEPRRNQHYYSTNISVPFAFQLNFGTPIHFLIELGGRLGVNVHTQYSADVYQTAIDSESFGKFEYEKTTLSLGAFLGLNGGVGVIIPLNERCNLVLKPDVGLNLYSGKPDFAVNAGPPANAYIRINFGLRFIN
ncbi:hypothetical protein [Fluviicola chungangensis]|uniref:PorT family protein n=1 Tax=Fluviicola chungangensis TaxID=2597671 RepID=A0A556N016_9FLAO|nr:hypothetical protein [Fluviicola chungangensis]TSJ45530.1 hypothetical protein FO442_07170 [Fluviicola chungangensis]